MSGCRWSTQSGSAPVTLGSRISTASAVSVAAQVKTGAAAAAGEVQPQKGACHREQDDYRYEVGVCVFHFFNRTPRSSRTLGACAPIVSAFSFLTAGGLPC